MNQQFNFRSSKENDSHSSKQRNEIANQKIIGHSTRKRIRKNRVTNKKEKEVKPFRLKI